MGLSSGINFKRVIGGVFSSLALRQAGWVTGMFLMVQVLRLGTNIVLAHLLTPAIFGVMALINSLRTGAELLTDVGVGQSIVVNPKGGEPEFYNTAWTLQIIRGAVLMGLGIIVAWPIAWLYGHDSLAPILMVCSTIYLIMGANSPLMFLLQRNRDVRTLSLIDALIQTLGLAATIGFALVMPSVWGMTWALVAVALINAATSYAFIDVRTLSLRIARQHLSAILHFGKWIFASSLIYFAATNFDRLYLPVHIPLSLFGVYGIARTMSDLATQLMQRLGTALVFPAVARESHSFGERMPRIVKLRSGGLALASMALGGGVAISDLFVNLAYDARYAVAAVILPILLAGAWFSVQATIAEAVLLGLAQPARAALSNLLKLVWMIVLIPICLARGNYLAAFLVIALADAPRYLALLVAQHRARLRFASHDLALLALMLSFAVLARALVVELGLSDGFVSSQQWADIVALANAETNR